MDIIYIYYNIQVILVLGVYFWNFRYDVFIYIFFYRFIGLVQRGMWYGNVWFIEIDRDVDGMIYRVFFYFFFRENIVQK